MHDPGMFAFQLSEHFGEDPGQPRIEHTDQLPRRAGWIQERPEKIENRSHILSGQTLPHLREQAKRRMVASGEKKTETMPLETFLQLFGREIDLDPELL
jgi:hypothetical protein